MRLLNSVCRVIASAYSGVPVHIEAVSYTHLTLPTKRIV